MKRINDIGFFERCMKIITILFRGIIFLVLLFWILSQTVWRVPGRFNEKCHKLDGEWIREYPDGTEVSFTVPCNLDAEIGEIVTIKKMLPDDVDDNSHLVIMAGRNMTISIDGEVRKVMNSSVKRYPGKAVKSVWIDIPISSSDAGKELKIYKDEPDTYNGRTNIPYYGSLYSIISLKLKETGASVVMSIGLAIISIIIVILCLILFKIYNKKLTMLYLGYAMLAVSIWLVVDSEFYQLIFDSTYADGELSFFLCMFIPYAFVKFMNVLQEGRYVKQYSIVGCMNLCVFVAFSILHFANIFNFERAIVYIDSTLILTIIVVVSLIAFDWTKGYLRKQKFIVIGIAGLIFFGFIEILAIIISPTRNDGTFAILGLYFLLIMTTINTIAEFLDNEDNRIRALNSNVLKSNFLANMSHEIRTPINTILGMNEMILRENTEPEIAMYADSIDRSGKLLLGLINDVLDFSKIESGKLEVNAEPYKSSTLFSDLAQLLITRATARGIKGIVDIDSSIPSVLDGDEIQIKRIAVNLITNAVKYTKIGQVILRIRFESLQASDKGVLVIELEDTGVGIREESIPLLFSAFTRLEERRNRNIEGTGLGLAIVKNMLDAMGGSIEVKSVYGQGSIFSARIPQDIIVRESIGENWLEPMGRLRSDVYKPSFIAPKARLLAVDDNNSNLMIIKQFLKATKVKIDIALSGSDGVRLATENKYDLILLDHMMPSPDGIETFHIIKSDEDGLNYSTPVIILTANAIAGSREQYIKEGFVDYISKPVDSRLLEDTVMKYISEDMMEDVEEMEFGTGKDTVVKNNNESKATSGFSALSDIKGFDYDTLIETFGGNTEFIADVLATTVEETRKKLSLIRKAVQAKDIKSYEINSHGIKGIMASIYYEPLRVHAKEHEFAAKDGNWEYITGDIDEFAKECEAFCQLIESII